LNLFLTGGTGFLGKAILVRLMDDPNVEMVTLLVRPSNGVSASARLEDMIARIFPPGRVSAIMRRVRAVPGDLTASDMGIARTDFDQLILSIDRILHVGASTDFGAPLRESRLHNVEGTLQALTFAEKLAERSRLKQFDYVSTAYVAGTTPGRVPETSLARNQTFANNYERSKYEAEILVREYAHKFPIAIYRPSIVVGNSVNGYTPHFKVLYWPLRLLSKNFFPVVPCNPAARLDVVPIDFVADGIAALMRSGLSTNRTWHLTAGEGHEISLRTLIEDAETFAGIARRPGLSVGMLKFIERTPLRRLFRDEFWEAVEIGRPYEAYLTGSSPTFDARVTHKVLAGLGVEPPRWPDYREEVLSFCRDSKWGRRLPMAEYVYYLPVAGAARG